MRVIVLGSDGYIGWPLSLHLKARGHEVLGIDNISRRCRVEEIGSDSATSILPFYERVNISRTYCYDLARDYNSLYKVIEDFCPDAIVHLAEQPSAPYSMIGRDHCLQTINENVSGTINLLYIMKTACPTAHLIKLGTMGEYGCPLHINISEDNPSMPREPGSWYHLSKVHDSYNIKFACDTWGLRCTDIMQSPVYGLWTDETTGVDKTLVTRFDFDEYFGTVLNRFCAQAVIGMPLTVYGEGCQTRGFIALRDSIQCIRLIAENLQPIQGRYTIINQLSSIHTINDLAFMVRDCYGSDVKISYIPNPRVEHENHPYNVETFILRTLGYSPSISIEDEIETTMNVLVRCQDRIKPFKHVILPTTTWR